MRGLYESDRPPGVLAYLKGVPAGWCSVSPRDGLSARSLVSAALAETLAEALKKGSAMGASHWSYSVPYRDDVAGALEQLRADIYERGEYHRQEPDATLRMNEDEFKATLDLHNDPDGIQEFLLQEWRKAKERPVPVDADTLIAAQPDSGTHSIIDIYEGLSETPDLFTASPLTFEQHLEYFGTDRPTTPEVLTWLSTVDIGSIRSRWEAVYLVSYSLAGQPEQIHFRGYSGD